MSREEVTLRLIRASYPRPLIALSQRIRSCTGTPVLSVCPGSYGVVNPQHESGVSPGKYQELVHSLLYERALRQSRHAMIMHMHAQMTEFRSELVELRDEMARKA